MNPITRQIRHLTRRRLHAFGARILSRTCPQRENRIINNPKTFLFSLASSGTLQGNLCNRPSMTERCPYNTTLLLQSLCLQVRSTQSGATTSTSRICGCFFARSAYQPRGNLHWATSAHVGGSADDQGFRKAVASMLAWCESLPSLVSAPRPQVGRDMKPFFIYMGVFVY